MEAILKVRGLKKHYPRFDLHQIDLDLPGGCIMGFVGENGAGKTTTLKCILNVAGRDGGSVELIGETEPGRQKTLMEEVGVVFSDAGFHPVMTGKDINQIMKGIYKNWQEEDFFGFLKRLKVDPCQEYQNLSRGTRIKLQLAAALSHQPRLLLLDEPTSGLDPVVRDEILEIFQEFILDERKSILFSTHITSDLEKIADYVTFIHQGRILLTEAKDDLLYRYGIWRGRQSELERLPEEAVLKVCVSGLGRSALVDRKKLESQENVERPTIEEILLYLVKGKTAGQWEQGGKTE